MKEKKNTQYLTFKTVEVTRRPSRATDLYEAFLLYTAPTRPLLRMRVGLTNMRFCPLASLFEIVHVKCFTASLTDGTFPRMSLTQTNVPRKGIAQPQSQFPHSCVCERFIYYQDRSAYSAAGKYVDRSWEYINRSLTP
jgi:hypothetical protein